MIKRIEIQVLVPGVEVGLRPIFSHNLSLKTIK